MNLLLLLVLLVVFATSEISAFVSTANSSFYFEKLSDNVFVDCSSFAAGYVTVHMKFGPGDFGELISKNSSESIEFSDVIKRNYGPDEILVLVEGAALLAKVPSYVELRSYVANFTLPASGQYRLKVVHLRSNFEALNELRPEYPELSYNVLVDTFLCSGNISTPRNSSLRPCLGHWIANHDNIFLKEPLKVFNSRDKSRGLDLSTYISITTQNQVHPSRSCADSIDKFVWQEKYSSSCQNVAPLLFNKEVNQASSPTPQNVLSVFNRTSLKHKKVLFVGDSHTRSYVQAIVQALCNADKEGFKKVHHNEQFYFDPSSSHPGLPGICAGVELMYNWNCYCDYADLPDHFSNYSKIFVNCGQHAASGSHYSAAKYQANVFDFVSNLTSTVGDNNNNNNNNSSSNTMTSRLVWIETVPQPFRNDHWVKNAKDWRTLHRIQLFNRISEDIMHKANIPIIRSFDALLPLVDKLCDEAHYTAQNALLPVVYQILREMI